VAAEYLSLPGCAGGGRRRVCKSAAAFEAVAHFYETKTSFGGQLLGSFQKFSNLRSARLCLPSAGDEGIWQRGVSREHLTADLGSWQIKTTNSTKNKHNTNYFSHKLLNKIEPACGRSGRAGQDSHGGMLAVF